MLQINSKATISKRVIYCPLMFFKCRFEVVWACDEKRGTLRRKDGDGSESTGGRKRGRPKRRWLDKVKDDIKEKVLSADEVYDRATWRRVSGVERRPAPRRGFRGECCPPTALHRLCGQRNGKLNACRRCWEFVNGL